MDTISSGPWLLLGLIILLLLGGYSIPIPIITFSKVRRSKSERLAIMKLASVVASIISLVFGAIWTILLYFFGIDGPGPVWYYYAIVWVSVLAGLTMVFVHYKKIKSED